MNTLIEKENIKRYYFLILRNIRHPLKDTKSLYNDEAKIDIYKDPFIVFFFKPWGNIAVVRCFGVIKVP